jgi:sec-independent protein translocase protein TatC
MSQQPYGTFFEHWDELRWRLVVSLGAFFICALPPIFYSDRLLGWLVAPLVREVPSVYFFSPADAFVVKIKVSLLAAAVLSSPMILGQLWIFVSPALYGNEKKAARPLILISSVLFVLGALFSFYVILPVTLHFLIGMQSEYMKPLVSVSEYISFLTSMILAFGVSFNLPVFILVPVAAGLVSAKMLNKLQRWAIVSIFILAAVLTPSPDVASQLLLAIPLLILFEISVLGAVIYEKIKCQKRTKAFS